MVEFANKLKNLRIQNHYTQDQLAQKLGVTKSQVSAYETGTRMPSYNVLIALARIFRVTTDYLLGVENKNTLDLSGLTTEEISAIQNLIRAISKHTNEN